MEIYKLYLYTVLYGQAIDSYKECDTSNVANADSEGPLLVVFSTPRTRQGGAGDCGGGVGAGNAKLVNLNYVYQHESSKHLLKR